jgi:hypothetical protein
MQLCIVRSCECLQRSLLGRVKPVRLVVGRHCLTMC